MYRGGRGAGCRGGSVHAVTAIVIDPLASNPRAHRLYRRIGFVPVARRRFGDDDCLVHRLTREAWRTRFPDD